MRATSWKARSVFVSSTFRDMNLERDALRQQVFSILAERLRPRKFHLESVDLRWGVETASLVEQEAKEFEVLKVCLDAVQRSRPFLVVLLGDRYGWIPPITQTKTIAEMNDISFEVDGLSVTALEIEYGVLSDPRMQTRSFFYFREGLPYEKMGCESSIYSDIYNNDPVAAAKQERLKERIRQLFPGRCRNYTVGWDDVKKQITGLEDFCKMVEANIWNELDLETSTHIAKPEPRWEDVEKLSLENFVEQSARGFVGRAKILDEIRRCLCPITVNVNWRESCYWCLVVEGSAGSGKSALFARTYQEIIENPEVFLLAHSFGSTPQGGNIQMLQRRWIDECYRHLGQVPNLPDHMKSEELDETLAAGIFQVSKVKPVVILIDAPDQAERSNRGRFLTWLPKVWPENVRLLVIGIPGEGTSYLKNNLQGVGQLLLPPIGIGDAEAIADNWCWRYRRHLNPCVKAAIMEKRASIGENAFGNPLWLTLMVEHLNLLDSHDFQRANNFPGSPEQQLNALLLDEVQKFPSIVQEAYRSHLNRSETLFGTNPVKQWLGAIAASRKGLRISDLESILEASGHNWTPVQHATLRRAWTMHIIEREGRLDFVHRECRSGIRSEVLGTVSAWVKMNSDIAIHLGRLSAEDDLRSRELMYHLIEANQIEKAVELYGDSSLGLEALTAASESIADRAILEGWPQWIGTFVSNGYGRFPLANHRLMMFVDEFLSDRGLDFARESMATVLITPAGGKATAFARCILANTKLGLRQLDKALQSLPDENSVEGIASCAVLFVKAAIEDARPWKLDFGNHPSLEIIQKALKIVLYLLPARDRAFVEEIHSLKVADAVQRVILGDGTNLIYRKHNWKAFFSEDSIVSYRFLYTFLYAEWVRYGSYYDFPMTAYGRCFNSELIARHFVVGIPSVRILAKWGMARHLDFQGYNNEILLEHLDGAIDIAEQLLVSQSDSRIAGYAFALHVEAIGKVCIYRISCPVDRLLFHQQRVQEIPRQYRGSTFLEGTKLCCWPCHTGIVVEDLALLVDRCMKMVADFIA